MKRVVRYAYGTRDLETFFPYGLDASELKIYTDADWAGDMLRRKSVSCAVMEVAGCVVCVICRGQGVKAQSSAESELYAAAMGLSEGAHLQQLFG